MYLSLWLARGGGFPEDSVLAVLPWAILGGIVGARVVHVVDNWDLYAPAPWRILLVNEGGIGLLGAILGGSLAAYAAALRLGLPAGPIADLAAPGLILGQAIGRIGDLINGEHLSLPTDLPWGVIYLDADSPGSRLPVHPAVGYELLWDLVVLGLLFGIRRRLPIPGMTYWSYLLLYSVGRFFISYLRLDPVWASGLQLSQLLALVAAYASAFALVHLARKPAHAMRRS